jgi:1-acyl-sn-glycerol-3-phosphate acyltransferase
MGWMGMIRLLYRLPLLLLHLLIGLPLTMLSLTSPARSICFRGRPLNEIAPGWWAGLTCRIYGLRADIHGGFRSGASLVVANHISWLDIPLLRGTSMLCFVSKGEIQKWPVIGLVASASDVVFHKRGSHDSASGVSIAMAERLQQGMKVAIFPEGGILPGHGVKRFHARLFAAAIDTGTPVQPVMIRYLLEGRHYPGKSFIPGESFIANVYRLLKQKSCVAQVSVLPLINPADKKRRELALESENAVKAAFEQGVGVELDNINRNFPDG